MKILWRDQAGLSLYVVLVINNIKPNYRWVKSDNRIYLTHLTRIMQTIHKLPCAWKQTNKKPSLSEWREVGWEVVKVRQSEVWHEAQVWTVVSCRPTWTKDDRSCKRKWSSTRPSARPQRWVKSWPIISDKPADNNTNWNVDYTQA